MPSTQCYEDLSSKDLCLHTGDRLTSDVMIKSKVIYSAIDYAELCKGCMALERTNCTCSIYMDSRACGLLDSA